MDEEAQRALWGLLRSRTQRVLRWFTSAQAFGRARNGALRHSCGCRQTPGTHQRCVRGERLSPELAVAKAHSNGGKYSEIAANHFAPMRL